MSWVEVFAVSIVCHLVGDFVLQTDWQARFKTGGLGADRVRRRALFSHVITYTLCFVPALIWIGIESGQAWRAVLVGVVVFVPHLVQDDGRLLDSYIRTVKGVRDEADPSGLRVAVDQAFHLVFLFGTALLAAG
ncbi:MAG TPA: DUF3307 domain-containing protein [Solirubrobacterales bacterium]|nr:DUF3307 domain-containing protein [Solirubrobacterales bacterium]